MIITKGFIPVGEFTGKWVVEIKGSADKDGEISVCREDNRFAHQSYGWMDLRDKFMIADCGIANWPYHPRVWNMLLEVAEKFANE